MKGLLLFMAALSLAWGEVRTLNLRDAIELALKQNPELTIARLEEQKAAQSVQIARDPFAPKIYVGSGAAKTFGFPMSVDGSAPSIFQARAVQSLYNRPRSFEVAAAQENARGAVIETSARREEIAYRTALLYLQAARARRSSEIAGQHLASASKVAAVVRERVKEGRELPIEEKRSALAVAQAKQRIDTLEAETADAETSLAVVLGYGPGDRVQPAVEDRVQPELPASVAASVAAALANSKDVRRLESALQARQFELRGANAARYPVIDLIAQYGLFAKFNNYEDFFRRFQRHNGQLGVSFTVPIVPGKAASGQAARAQLEMTRLRAEINVVRDRITMDTRRRHQELQKAGGEREVARLDLDLAREQVSVLLAQMEEGRAGLRQVEEARAVETGKWLTFLDAQHAVDRAQMELLHQTGTLLTALK